MIRYETRIIPLTDDFMKDKKVYANVWGYLQTISYLSKDKQRFVYKSTFTLKDMHETIARKEGGRTTPSLSTVKNVWNLYKELGYVKEDKLLDLHNEEVEVYILSQDFARFQPIPLETLSFLVNVSNSNVIKVYAYLLNKYKYKQQTKDMYTFTLKELLFAIGYSYKYENTKMMNDILQMLNALKLIDYKIEYYKAEKNPIPILKLLYVNEYIPKEKETKEEKKEDIKRSIDYGFTF